MRTEQSVRRRAGWPIEVGLVLLVLVASPRVARGAFNEIIAGARPQGMGGAFVGLANDANALFYNPAGIVQIGTAEATFMHANKFDITDGPELELDFLGFANWPMNVGTFGLSVFKEGSSEIIEETTLALSYATRVSDYGSIGINFKYLEIEPSGRQVNNADPSLTDQETFSLDIGGLLWITPTWSMGLMIRNIGGEIGVGVEEELEPTYRLGSAYRFEDLLFLNDTLVWLTDLYTKNDVDDEAGFDLKVSSGIEYVIDDRFAIRAGVNQGDLTVGLGFGHPEAGIFVDYAFADNDLGKTHRISATYRFGAPPNEIHVVHHPPPPSDIPPEIETFDEEMRSRRNEESAYAGEPPDGNGLPAGRRTAPDYRRPADRSQVPPPRRPIVPSDRAEREFQEELSRFLNE